MNLSLLPDLRAAAAPDAPAVSDDTVDLDNTQFVDAVRRVAEGGTAMDPEVISQILARRSRVTPLAGLTPREREVLALMAEGRTNIAIARSLVITTKAVSKYIARIFAKLDLPPSDDDHRRVLAVLAYLNSNS